MADEKIAVRIFFKTDNGLGSVGEYQFDAETLKKLRQDFLNHVNRTQTYGGIYECEVMRQGSLQYVPTVLMLRFSEVLYIG
jgi:hypothetical protein